MPRDGRADLTGGSARFAADQRMINLVHFARGELCRERNVRLVVLGDDEAAAGFLVEPVDDARPRHAADAAQRTFAMVEQGVDERVFLVAGGGMHHDAGGLVQHEQRFVLEQNIERDFFRLHLGRSRLGPVDADLVAGMRAVGGLDDLAVHQDVALLDQALQVAARGGGIFFGKIFVQPPGGQGFLDGEIFRAVAHDEVCVERSAECSCFQVIKNISVTPVQMAESATLNAGNPSSPAPRRGR